MEGHCGIPDAKKLANRVSSQDSKVLSTNVSCTFRTTSFELSCTHEDNKLTIVQSIRGLTFERRNIL
jgi:hypothetical protein